MKVYDSIMTRSHFENYLLQEGEEGRQCDECNKFPIDYVWMKRTTGNYSDFLCAFCHQDSLPVPQDYYVYEIVEDPMEVEVVKCTCDMDLLLRSGCKCGGT